MILRSDFNLTGEEVEKRLNEMYGWKVGREWNTRNDVISLELRLSCRKNDQIYRVVKLLDAAMLLTMTLSPALTEGMELASMANELQVALLKAQPQQEKK